MSGTSTRRAQLSDFELVSALLAELGRPPLTGVNRKRLREVYRRHVERLDTASLVAEVEGTVVGFLALERRERLNRVEPQAWIADLVVAESQRMQGVGTALLQAAYVEAKAWGCATLALEAGYHRQEAHQFCMARGLQDCGKYFSIVL